MRIIIIGDGKIGYTLAKNLAQEHYDVTVIDKDAEALRRASDELDVLCVHGNGLSSRVQIEAGVREADLLIAVTINDEINMVCCLTAKQLGAAHTIARIRDPEYAEELSQLKTDLNLDMIINPEQETAAEIARLIKYPAAMEVETFAGGRVEMLEVKVTNNLALVGNKLKDLPKKMAGEILIGGVVRGERGERGERGGRGERGERGEREERGERGERWERGDREEREDEVFIPNGEFKLAADDVIYVFGKPSAITNFIHGAGLPLAKIRSAMIIGGGRIAFYLAKYLEAMGVKVKILEISHERCLELSELLPDTLIIHGDGTDENLLLSENLEKMDTFITLTGHDEDNLIAGLLAKQHGVKKVVAKINRMNYSPALQKLGIDSIIIPRNIVASEITRYVRGLKNAEGNPAEAMHKIMNERAEAASFTAGANVKFLDIPLREITFTDDILVAVIVHGDEVRIAHGNDRIQAGDRVILVAKDVLIEDLNEIVS